MVKFQKVKDLTRVRKGDIVVFPKGSKLNLRPTTLCDLGLSIGETSRSDNDVRLVRDLITSWSPSERCLAFYVATVSAHAQDNRTIDDLIGLDVRRVAEAADPEIYGAYLVPLDWARPESPKMSKWVAAWSESATHSVTKAADEALKGVLAKDTAAEGPDGAANQVYDLPRQLVGREDDPRTWRRLGGRWSLPLAGHAIGDLSSLVSWSCYPKDCRIYACPKFLANVAHRGAYGLRPSKEWIDAMNGMCLSWLYGEVAERYEERMRSSKFFSRLLSDAIAADRTRVAVMKRLGRKAAQSAKADPLAGLEEATNG